MNLNKIATAFIMMFAVYTTAATTDLKQVKQNHDKAAIAEKMRAQKVSLNEATQILKLIKTGKAISPQNCSIGGGRCSFDSDCCSNNCYAGTCQSGSGGCSDGGGSCSFDSDCCSGNCYAGTCQSACIGTGNSCTYDHECCGGNCNSLGRCGSEPVNCQIEQ